MSTRSEVLLLQIRQIIATMPSFDDGGWESASTLSWLGRAHGVIDATGDTLETMSFKVAMDNLGGLSHISAASSIPKILYRVLGRLELQAPSAMQGGFIAAGEELKAMAVVAQVFARAKSDLLLIDGYADHVVLTDFAVTAPTGVRIRLLSADKLARRDALLPAAQRWHSQYKESRPLDIRLVQSSSLHDRLIIVDKEEVWLLGQSFNGMAHRAHTAVSRVDTELATMKVVAYSDAWASATPLEYATPSSE